MPERKQLSPHFNLAEFHTHDGTEVPEAYEDALKRLCVYILEPMRAKYGPCKVLSAYRHRAYNQAIGGARYSYHIYDEHSPLEVAVDVRFTKGNVNAWRRSAIYRLGRRYGIRRGGVGRYPASNFVHIDTRLAGRSYWEG